ncbi:MAG: glycosyltransferase family 4 protein [Lentisphaeraceae bacterium]|nr:glycosyltransferase family 4 protein [Lentisphaeraceae bacterium]
MDILLLSLIFNPDNVSTAQIMAALAEDLQKQGNRVCVVTTTPHYHRDVAMEAAQPLRPWLGRIIQRSEIGEIPVWHIWMPDKSIWPPLRILSWLWFHGASVLLACALRFRPQVLIACSPPITIGLAAWAIAALKRCRYLYNVQELYPDIAVNLGYLKHPWAIRAVSAVEHFIYRHATAVTSITPAMCAKIRARTEPGKVRLIPNFVELPTADELAARTSPPHAGLVITYAGNMGVPQNLGLLVEAAAQLDTVTIRLIGDGGDRKRLEALARDLGVCGTKVRFEGYRPLSEMPKIYAESDLFYVAQSPQACSDGIPSKIYRILGNRKPLLVVTAQEADLATFVRETQGGVVVSAFTPEAVAEVIRSLAPARLAEMAERGYQAMQRDYSRERVTAQYGRLVTEMIARD